MEPEVSSHCGSPPSEDHDNENHSQCDGNGSGNGGSESSRLTCSELHQERLLAKLRAESNAGSVQAQAQLAKREKELERRKELYMKDDDKIKQKLPPIKSDDAVDPGRLSRRSSAAPSGRSSENMNNCDDYESDDDNCCGTDDAPKLWQKHLLKQEENKKRGMDVGNRNVDKATWLRKRGLPEDTKVFYLCKGYPALRSELINRGWVENEEKSVEVCDFIGTIKLDIIRNNDIRDDVIVNRYLGTGEMCSKAGLLKNIKNVPAFLDFDSTTFFPRCYSLAGNGGEELEEFMIDFKVTAAERFLKILRQKRETGEVVLVSNVALRIIYRVVQRFLNRTSDELLDEPIKFQQPVISEVEWGILQNTTDDLVLKPDFERQLVEGFQHSDFPKNLFPLMDIVEDRNPEDPEKAKEYSGYLKYQLKQLSSNVSELAAGPLAEDMAEKCSDALEKLLAQRGDQSRINGPVGDNVWIVKPAGKSRGRGIQCFGDLKKLLKYTGLGNHDVVPWVVQKYMENSLIVHKRKFDIRQWVMVTNWNPLTIYFYDNCYLRFCVGEYSLDDLDDKYIHLANNSISKTSEQFYNGPIKENMWTRDEFIAHLDSIKVEGGGHKMFHEIIKKKMQDIVRCSFACCQDFIHFGSGNTFDRENNFEIFGFDFMIDDQLNPWLIEINSVPSMECSTEITTKMVTEALTSSVAVVLDAKYDYLKDGTKRVRQVPKNVDTGEWVLMHNSDYVIPTRNFDNVSDLILSGERIRKPVQAPVVKEDEAPKVDFIARNKSMSSSCRLPDINRRSSIPLATASNNMMEASFDGMGVSRTQILPLEDTSVPEPKTRNAANHASNRKTSKKFADPAAYRPANITTFSFEL